MQNLVAARLAILRFFVRTPLQEHSVEPVMRC